MAFVTPQADIDKALAVERSVTSDEKASYLECMNGRPLSERLSNPSKDEDIPGRDVRDGCILTGVFIQCRPKPVQKLKRYTKKQVIDFAKKNVATSDYAFSERSGSYTVTVPKKKK